MRRCAVLRWAFLGFVHPAAASITISFLLFPIRPHPPPPPSPFLSFPFLSARPSPIQQKAKKGRKQSSKDSDLLLLSISQFSQFSYLLETTKTERLLSVPATHMPTHRTPLPPSYLYLCRLTQRNGDTKTAASKQERGPHCIPSFPFAQTRQTRRARPSPLSHEGRGGPSVLTDCTYCTYSTVLYLGRSTRAVETSRDNSPCNRSLRIAHEPAKTHILLPLYPSTRPLRPHHTTPHHTTPHHTALLGFGW
ncbi:hypothetical protein LZ31DRAFT_220419 [Colletotrichum somersetense]|nr:hypothetical protein LZ31DRAFT_220419 [Colletotrichum somersetense]